MTYPETKEGKTSFTP